MDFAAQKNWSFVRIIAVFIASRLRLFGDVSNCHGVLPSWRSRTLKLGKYRLYKCFFFQALFHFRSPQTGIIKLEWWIEAIFSVFNFQSRVEKFTTTENL